MLPHELYQSICQINVGLCDQIIIIIFIGTTIRGVWLFGDIDVFHSFKVVFRAFWSI